MGRYTKAFIFASLAYLVLGGGLGVLMGVEDYRAMLHFTHVHFNLLGFMAMMIFGVGYFILPRFNARKLKWPGMVAWHFYLANLGLIGMCLFRLLQQTGGSPWFDHAFALFTLVEMVSLVLFVVNMVGTLLAGEVPLPAMGQGVRTGAAVAPQAEPAASAAAGTGARSMGQSGRRGREPDNLGSVSTAAPISGDTRVGDVLTECPSARRVFVEAGIRALADPAHAEQIKRMPVTVATACQRHSIDMEDLLDKLNKHVARVGSAGEPVSAEMTIGEAISHYPATRVVFQRYFGEGCFDCPGQSMESVAQGAMMHNVAVDELLRDLNEAVIGSAGDG